MDKKLRKPLDPRIKRLLLSAAIGLAFGFGCRFLPEEYRAVCTGIGRLLSGGLP